MSGNNFNNTEIEETEVYKTYDVHKYTNITFEFIDKDTIVVNDIDFKSPLTGEIIPVKYQLKNGFFYPVDMDENTPSILNKEKRVNLDFNIQLLHERKMYMERNNIKVEEVEKPLSEDYDFIEDKEQEL